MLKSIGPIDKFEKLRKLENEVTMKTMEKTEVRSEKVEEEEIAKGGNATRNYKKKREQSKEHWTQQKQKSTLL